MKVYEYTCDLGSYSHGTGFIIAESKERAKVLLLSENKDHNKDLGIEEVDTTEEGLYQHDHLE